MKYFKAILPGIILSAAYANGFAGTAVEQLSAVSGTEIKLPAAQENDLTGAEIQSLRANPDAQRKYMIDRCTRLIAKPEAQITAYLNKLKKEDPAKYEAYEECFVPEVTITPGEFEGVSGVTKQRIAELKEPQQSRDAIGAISTLISIGNSIINVIKGGEIVYNNGYAAVYPKNADWRYFTWAKQAVYTFNYKKKIVFGTVPVINSTIVASFKYDGEYKGHGQYIGNIQVVGDKCWTIFNNKLDVKAELPPSSVENINPATPLEPLAAIDLNITYTTTGIVTHTRMEHYKIKGDGNLVDAETGNEPTNAEIKHINLKK